MVPGTYRGQLQVCTEGGYRYVQRMVTCTEHSYIIYSGWLQVYIEDSYRYVKRMVIGMYRGWYRYVQRMVTGMY